MAGQNLPVEKPQAGQSVQTNLSEGQTNLMYKSGDVQDMKVTGEGKLLVTFTDGGSLTINNFKDLASKGTVLTLADGKTINTADLLTGATPSNDTTAQAEILVGQPAPGEEVVLTLESGQKYNFSFNNGAKENVEQANGALIITFDDGGKLVLKNFSEALDAAEPIQIAVEGDVISLGEFADFLKLADAINDKMDQEKPVMSELRDEAGDVSKIEPASGDEAAAKQVTSEDMAALAKQLAGVEPAAGDAGGGSAGSRGGFGFQSAVDSANINPLNAIGPIGPTALQFGLPQPQEPLYINEEPEPLGPPSITANAGVDNAIVKEDGSVFVPIVASTGTGADGDEVMTVTVTGINPAWGVTFTTGTYNPATGTWTVTLAPGQSYNGGLTFTPPADTDADMPGLTATVSVYDPDTNTTQTSTDPFNVVTDAVADAPTVNADDNAGVKNTALAVDISGAVTDTDGSETITHYQVSGVPAGFTFNQGTDLGGGVWQFTPAQLAGLTMSAPLNYHGSISLVATAFSGETALSGGEVDYTDNTNSASDPFVLTWTPKITPPDITLDNKLDLVNAQVKEDGTVDIPLKAVLGVDAEPTEYLTVTVTGIPSSWGFSAPVGTYNAATGTWTITVAPGQNLNTVLTFTPPANSDIDLSGLNATATVTQPSSGLTASDSDAFGIIVDAVADKPTINAVDGTLLEGQGAPVKVTAALTDTDGSEIITHYQISNVPAGFSFNAGTNLGGGVWQFQPSEMTNALRVTPPAGFNGTVDFTVTVFNTENPVSDAEFDPADNNNSASDILTITWTPTIDVPDITVNRNVDDVIVKEDGSIGVPITATLGANPSPTEYLTVTVSGISPAWGFSAPVGTYNAAAGTWTVTLAPGQNLSTIMTFTPPANSDLDLNGLNAVVVATDPSSGLSATDSDAFRIIVDAVADKPTLTVSAPTVEEGHNVPLTINAAVTDKDGSETITHYQISNVPAGFGFTTGTNLGGGVWQFTPAQIAGLQLVPPSTFSGNLQLKVKVFNAETTLGGTEVDTTDNTNFNETTLTVKIDRDDVPVLVQPETVTVDETNMAATGSTSVSDKVDANFFADGPGTFSANGGFFAGIPLTSNGVAVAVTLVGGVYTGKAGADTVFTLTLQPNGQYTFNLVGTLDHPNTADHNDNIALQFGVRATDSEGDHADGVITVNVLDDGVNAHDDFADVPTSTGTVSGNVVTNDSFSQDEPNTVTEVSFGGTTVTVPATGTVSIAGNYGVLTLSADGSYTYKLNGSTSGIGVSEKEFTTTNTYPAQSEGVALNPAGNFYGITAGDLTVSDPATGTITFRSEGAGYNNTIGMFTYGPDGKIVASQVLIPNGNAAAFGNSFDFSVTAGQTVGFFLIANGYSTNPGVDLSTGSVALVYKYGTPDARPASVMDSGADVVMVHTSTTGVQTVLTEPMYFSSERGGSTSLNEDGSVRVVSGLVDPTDPTVLRVGFEDLPNMGDRDFNDIVFDVTLNVDCGCAEDEFTYTLTDGDGDKDTAVLTIECIDDDTNPVIVKPADKVVDETNLAGGNVTTNGQLTANFFADGPGTFGNTGTFSSSLPLTSNGVAVVVTLVAGTYVGKAGATTVFTLATGADGKYTFTLLDTLDHPDKNNHDDNIALNFGVKATDGDGDTDVSVLTVNVKDDGVDAVNDANTFGNSVGHVDGNVLTNDYRGQDLPSRVTKVEFGGTSVTVPATGDVTIAGQYGTLKINANGTYTYTVADPNRTGDAQDQFTYTLTDADGDSDKATLTLKSLDDDTVPVITPPQAKVVDETDLGTGPVSTSGQLVADFKADAPGSFGSTGTFTSSVPLTSNGVAVVVTQSGGVYTGKAGTTTVFTLTVLPNGQYSFNLVDTLDHPNKTDHDDNIALNFGVSATDSDGDTVTTTLTINVKDDGVDARDDSASALSSVGHVDGNVLTNDYRGQDLPSRVTKIEFGTTTVTVPATGEVSITGQYGVLKIKADGTFTYTLSSSHANGQDKFTYTLTDADGDSDKAVLTIQNTDDNPVPVIVQPQAKVVDETDLGAGTVSTSGQLVADFKGDNPGSFGSTGTFTSSVPLTSGGVAVVVTQSGGVYTGKAGTTTVFTLTVLPNGQYTFNLVDTLDHPNKLDHNDNIALNFGVKATDSNGDVAATTLTVNVLDDGVDAVADSNTFDGGLINYVVAGNVLTNDYRGQDTVSKVTKVEFGGTSVNVPATGEVSITGQFGTLKIKADGSYTYTTTKLNGTTDQFTYTLTDADGDSDKTTLTLNGIAPNLIVGENVDDIPGSTTPWEVGGGIGQINGGGASDILIGDVGGATMKEQKRDYNIVLMLDVSGSMAEERIALLKLAVNNLMTDFHDYQGGQVKVHIVPFSDGAQTAGTFDLTTLAGLNAAMAFVNNLTADGFTNYEAPMQSALNWLDGLTANDPIPGGTVFSYFVSDGEPNRYLTPSGTVGVGTADQVMGEIQGSDGTNEVARLQGFGEVVGVGIGVNATTIGRLSIIDSGSDSALDVRFPEDLNAALQGASPLNQPAAVGNDILTGGNGNDIMFGDTVNTDALALAKGVNLPAGSGWAVFAQLEAGGFNWTRADTISYIKANAVSMAAETVGSNGAVRSGGDDVLRGGAGDDLIFGQEGEDKIYGGAGNDSLYGGSGADDFIYEGLGDGVDTIKDFSVAQGDALDLSGLLSAYDPLQDSINDFVFATSVNGNTVVSVDVTGSGNFAGAQTVAVLQGVTGITNVEDILSNNSGGHVA